VRRLDQRNLVRRGILVRLADHAFERRLRRRQHFLSHRWPSKRGGRDAAKEAGDPHSAIAHDFLLKLAPNSAGHLAVAPLALMDCSTVPPSPLSRLPLPLP